MKYFLSLFIFLMMSGMIMISCDDSPTDHGTGDAVVFPNHVGDTWTYEIFDSTAATYDTVVVTIVAIDTAHYYENAKIWEYQFRARVESTIVTISGNTVCIYPTFPDIYQTPYETYIFPLHIGDQWTSEILMDTTEVMGKGPVSTRAENFGTSYRIQRRWSFIDNAGEINYWFVAYRGMVKIANYRVTISGLHVQFWDLLSYNVHLPGI